MAFLDHIERCNAHDLRQFMPWWIGATQAGWVHRDFAAAHLATRPDLFGLSQGGWHLSPALSKPETRTRAVETFFAGLRDEGTIRGWRNEQYPVTPRLSLPPLMGMERAAVPLMGVRAFGVHMTGFVRRADGIHIWVPRRARSKPTYPGMLDNTVAGGHPVGMSLHDNVVKECFEEAGIPAHIARRAVATGFVSYVYQSGLELKPDIQYCFDLELPDDFVPEPQDGEAEAFMLWPLQQVLETVRDTMDFKYNCNLVLIDFFVRHGAISPDDPQWLDIAAGLRQHPHGLVAGS